MGILTTTTQQQQSKDIIWKRMNCCSEEFLFPTVTFSLDSAIVLIVLFTMVNKVIFQARLSKAKSR